MSTFLITQSRFSEVRPIDPSVRLTGGRLWTILQPFLTDSEVTEFKPYFADPEPVEGAAATDWYTDWEADGTPISQLDPERRDKVLASVGRVCARIASVADMIEAAVPGSSDASYLRAAIAIPNNQDYIYVFGDNPVIVAWGHKLAGAGKAPVPAGIWIKTAPSDVAPPLTPTRVSQTETAAPSTVLATGGVAARPGIGWLAWLLWTLFLALFLLILWVLFSACSIGSPQSTLAQRLGLMNHCPVPAQIALAPVTEQSDRSNALQQAIRTAELALAEEAQNCRVVRREEDATRRALLEQTPAPEPVPDLPQNETLAEEADERVLEAGGQTGEMQVVLQWDGPADLDMSVECSSGSISYSSRASCSGGVLDVDANYEVDMERPVENIHWAEMPPPGTYGLRVRNHSSRGDPRSEIPFSVLVRRGDEEQTFSGRAAPGEVVSITDIVVE